MVYNEEVTEKQFLKTIVESGQEESSDAEEGEPDSKRLKEDSERKTYDEEYGHVPVRRPGKRGRPPKHRKEYHREPMQNGFESSLGEQGVETFDSAKQKEAEHDLVMSDE